MKPTTTYLLIFLLLLLGALQVLAQNLDVNGTIAAKQILVETNTETKDLLALITELQYEVEELKQKYRCLAETHFVTNETR